MDKKVVFTRVNGDTREDYLHNLFNQFISATGYSSANSNSKSCMNEFKNWLREREKILYEYKSVLNYMDLGYDYPMTAEVGKGIYDSVAVNNRSTTIITPYIYFLKDGSRNRIIKGNLKLVDSSFKKKDITEDKVTSFIDSFMTHNLYSNLSYSLFRDLYNLYNYGIIVGVYGSKQDLDKEIKLDAIREFRDQLCGDVRDEYITINGDYCYVIASNDKRKTKVKFK